MISSPRCRKDMIRLSEIAVPASRGGQKQLIAVARAFLKDAPILILDEATSSLDPESSSMVIKAAADLMKSRSTLIITHREDIASMADSVVSLGGPTPSD